MKKWIPISLAALLSSCSDGQLPNGYRIRVADRGKTWLHDQNDLVVLNNVTALGHDGRRIFAETRQLRVEPPYGYDDCHYHVTDTQTHQTVDLASGDQAAIANAQREIRWTKTLLGSGSCLH
jgi:hypothetical protein